MTATILAEATPRDGFFPAEFAPSLVMSLIFAVVALGLFWIFWKVIDKVTPGDLNKEILGTPATETTPAKAPNIALAIIVGFLALGFCQIIAAAVK